MHREAKKRRNLAYAKELYQCGISASLPLVAFRSVNLFDDTDPVNKAQLIEPQMFTRSSTSPKSV